MSSYLLLVIAVLSVTSSVYGKPVSRDTVEDAPRERRKETGLAYDNYLQQVVDVLESDPGFRKKLETANISDIKNGKIAEYLDMVNHSVRTVLNELKRHEVARLKELAHLQLKASGRGGLKHMEIPAHLDIHNPHSFEMDDLKKLILKTTSDLEELDRKRQEEFKEYEMEKEYEKEKHLRELSEEERKKEEARLEALKKKHAEHPKVHHPGSKDQFEEVWEKTDHLEDQEFDPRTFFALHDLNGDREWDMEETEAVLQMELRKMYDERNSPEEDDPIEREAEMNRMRKHIFEEVDKDRNLRISLEEFLDYTGPKGDKPEFEKDEGWKTVDEEPVFSEEDYKKFVESHHAEAAAAAIQHSDDLKFQPEHVQGERHEVNPNQHQEQAQQHPQHHAPEHVDHQGQQVQHQQEQAQHHQEQNQQQQGQHQQDQNQHQQQQGHHQQQGQQQEQIHQQPHVIEQKHEEQGQHAQNEVAEEDKIKQQIRELQEKLERQLKLRHQEQQTQHP